MLMMQVTDTQLPTPYTNEILSWKVGTPAIVSSESTEYILSFNTQLTANNYDANGAKQKSLPGHPAFRFTKAQKAQPYGGNCPIIAMAIDNGVQPFQDQRSSSYVDLIFRGRYGEMTDGLFNGIDLSIKLNGEEIINGMTNMWQLGQKTTGISQGVLDVELVNHNGYVDGLEGQNKVTMQYDAGREDWTPPTLTMLQFRNTDDDVTDRFETASDGVVSLSAGDKAFHPEPSFGWGYYTIDNDMTVEVAYSPYGKDEWQQLGGIEEKPEYYYFPEYGYFYQGSLAGVTAQSDNGWFDLKIRLEDASGNWQEQTVSPAFRIESQVSTGICTQAVACGANAQSYSLDGRRLNAPQRGINIVKGSDGTTRKVIRK